MKREDFRVGEAFYCGGRPWRCTAVGEQLILAVPGLWAPEGTEHSFEPSDMAGCRPTKAAWKEDFA